MITRDPDYAIRYMRSRYVSRYVSVHKFVLVRTRTDVFHDMVARDMFHDMFPKRFTFDPFTICFTICLCVSPDLDGNWGTKNETMCPDRPDETLSRLRAEAGDHYMR